MFVLQTAGLKYREVMLLVIAYIYILIIYETKTCSDFYFYFTHIGLATKTDQTIFGIDPKLHIFIEHLAHEWKYCIILQFELNIDWYFSAIDLRKAYREMEFDESSTMYVTINTQKGLYVYNRLVFGIKSALAIWQRAMDQVLQGFEGTWVTFWWLERMIKNISQTWRVFY